MGQVLHGSAKTKHAIRAAIQRSQASIKALSEQFGLNPKTVMKWKKRDFVDDGPNVSRRRSVFAAAAPISVCGTTYLDASKILDASASDGP